MCIFAFCLKICISCFVNIIKFYQLQSQQSPFQASCWLQIFTAILQVFISFFIEFEILVCESISFVLKLSSLYSETAE